MTTANIVIISAVVSLYAFLVAWLYAYEFPRKDRQRAVRRKQIDDLTDSIHSITFTVIVEGVLFDRTLSGVDAQEWYRMYVFRQNRGVDPLKLHWSVRPHPAENKNEQVS